jgi:V/A-type H+-transporting ATPase subunit E
MSGISAIVKTIESKTSDRIEKILNGAKQYRERYLEEARHQAALIKAENYDTTKAGTESEIKKYEASSRLRARLEVLQARERLLQAVLDDVSQRLEESVTRNEYDKILMRLIDDAAKTLNAAGLDVLLPRKQKTGLTDKRVSKHLSNSLEQKVEAKISDESVRATGGVIVRTADRERMVDNTYEGRIRRFEDDIRIEILRVLFGEDQPETL